MHACMLQVDCCSMHEVSEAVGGAEPGMVWAQGLNLQAINAETDRRGYVPVSEKMEVLDKSGKPVTNVFCIGDANGVLTTLAFRTLLCVPYFGHILWITLSAHGSC